MNEKFKDFLESIKNLGPEEIDLDVDSSNITWFLGGMAVTMVLVASLAATGIIPSEVSTAQLRGEELSADEAGDKTVSMVNRRILHNTPNNVTAEFVEAESADDEGLPGFYKVTVNVKNPTEEQETEVFTKKDGELVFLQFPRYFDQEKYESQRHQ